MTNETHVHFKHARAGAKRLKDGEKPVPVPPRESIPRISRLIALAIHFDDLILKGAIRDYADLARLSGLTRARITQIMSLLNLAPEIQEKLLFLPGVVSGRDTVTERDMRAVCYRMLWSRQNVSHADVAGE